jgi:hypothetical protein
MLGFLNMCADMRKPPAGYRGLLCISDGLFSLLQQWECSEVFN